MKRTISIACMTAALAAPAVAQAHVTLQPEEAPAGGFTRLDVRVPNERDNASTTKVEVQFPAGFEFVSTQPVPGWTAEITRKELAQPVTNDEGEEVTDRVDTVTWTGSGAEGRIGPGQFQDFGLSLGVPDEPGRTLTFKAIQTYDNGETVRWINAPDADEPAPQVKLTAAEGGGHAAETADEDDSGAPKWLAVLALVVGAGGLIAGVAALGAARRRTA
ncbi:MAG: YcnI family protein [Thermoleophilaceae bacterium]|nr:YcnI family protein [Thermoleophilaceae bacterium]